MGKNIKKNQRKVNTKQDIKGKTVNIGVDVHKRSWRITTLVDEVMNLARVRPISCLYPV